MPSVIGHAESQFLYLSSIYTSAPYEDLKEDECTNARHLMYDGLFEEEVGNPKDLWYGWLKHSSICYKLDPNYFHSDYGWTNGFIEKCKSLEERWVQVEAGAKFLDNLKSKNPSAKLAKQGEIMYWANNGHHH
eukprot:12830750-Ditylum_brightwellii.AAC.1